MSEPHSLLSGIRVVDFGHHVAGPLAGLLLADQGAEVIKVDRPAGGGSESAVREILDRGKQRIRLDLKSETDLRFAQDLVATADVLIENFRPGVMARLRLGAEWATGRNPRLVYLSLPGFASGDAEWRDLPAWEGVIGAATGVYTDLNIIRRLLGASPVYTPLPYGSVYGAAHGAVAATMALIAREASGKGDIIEVPLASAALSAMGTSLLNIPDQPRRYDLPPLHPIVRRLLVPALRSALAIAGPRIRERTYQFARKLTPAFMTDFPCADDRRLFVLAMDHRRHARDLLCALGLLEEFERENLKVRDAYAPGGGRNNLADTAGLSYRRQRRLARRLSDRLRQKSADDWEALLAGHGVPCAKVRSTPEWLQIEALRAAGIVADMNHPHLGTIRQPGPFCWVKEPVSALPEPRPARMLGEDDRGTLLARHRRRADDADEAGSSVERPASVLRGVKVLDLSTMIAAPVCARTLAEYGADVIKVTSPTPHHGPRMLCWFGVDVDQGKRSILLDLKAQEGRAIFEKLLTRADILVHNMSAAAARRLGLRRRDLAKVNPDIVLARVGSFEGPADGPWASRKAYDPVLQAASGIMMRYGSASEPEYHGIASCVDYLTGYLGALAAGLALFRRGRDRKTGGAESVTSLAQGAQLAQLIFAYDLPGRAWREPSGQQSRGEHALQRLYRARDGWFYLGAAPDTLAEIFAEPRLQCPADLSAKSDCELARFLEQRFRRQTVSFWDRLFRPLDVAVYPVRALDDIRTDVVTERPEAPFVGAGSTFQIIRQRHPIGRRVDTVAPAHARLRNHPLRYLDPAAKFGQHTIEILGELGTPAEEVKRLLDSGIASESLSDAYLPP